MYPISYKTVDKRVEFFYDQKEWDEWIALGKKDGNVGGVMKYIENKSLITWFSFGTYENPMTDMITMTMVNNPLFDGPLEEPDFYLKPLAEERARQYWADKVQSMRMVFLDFSDDKTIIEPYKPEFKTDDYGKPESET